MYEVPLALLHSRSFWSHSVQLRFFAKIRLPNDTSSTSHNRNLSNLSWIFFSKVLTKTTFGIFVMLQIEILTILFSFSLTWDPIGVINSKRHSYISYPKVLKLILNFPPYGPHKTKFGIFKILNFRLLMIFEFSMIEILNSPLYHIGKPKTSVIWKTSNRRAKRSESWELRVLVKSETCMA